MIALKILDVKKFMAALLTGPMFGRYLLAEARITTFCTWIIDGRRESAFYGEASDTDSPGDKAAAGLPSGSAGIRQALSSSGASGQHAAQPVPYIRWDEARASCFSVIRGKRAPLSFRFVLYYPPENTEAFLRRRSLCLDPSVIAGLCLNIRFDSSGLILTTGTSLKTFSTDRSIDREWDDYAASSLRAAGIASEPAG